MSRKIENIVTHTPKQSDCYFFDCNVWIHLLGAIGNTNKNKQIAYSELLKEIQTVRATIFVNSLILSEFCNVSLRISYNKWRDKMVANNTDIEKKDFGYKKDYVGTPEYKSNACFIQNQLNKIYALAELCTDNLNSLNTEKINLNFGVCDFNDSYYLQLCEKSKYKLVTDDKDFFKPDIDTLTHIITDHNL